MSRMRCTELAKYKGRSVIEVMDMDAEKVIKYVLAYNFNNARPYGDKWENGDYYNVDDILGLKADEQLKAAMLKLYDIKEPKIPYDRVLEFANEFMKFMIERDYTDELISRYEMTEDEAELFGIKDKLFPKRYKVVEVSFVREQRKTVKVVMPDDEDNYNAEDYVENRCYLEDDGDCENSDWECDYFNAFETGMSEEDVTDRYDLDELWNGCDFPDDI